MDNLKAVIYCRVSSKEQTEGYSLKYQEEECRRFANRYNIEIIGCSFDELKIYNYERTLLQIHDDYLHDLELMKQR